MLGKRGELTRPRYRWHSDAIKSQACEYIWKARKAVVREVRQRRNSVFKGPETTQVVNIHVHRAELYTLPHSIYVPKRQPETE